MESLKPIALSRSRVTSARCGSSIIALSVISRQNAFAATRRRASTASNFCGRCRWRTGLGERVPGREIDRDHEIDSLVAQVAPLPRRLLEHPQRQRMDEAALL